MTASITNVYNAILIALHVTEGQTMIVCKLNVILHANHVAVLLILIAFLVQMEKFLLGK